MKKYILIVALFLFSGVAYSQTPTPTPTDAEFDLVERSKMVAEITKLKVENDGLKTQVIELKNQVEIYKRLDTVQESRVLDLKEALKFRTNANNIDIKIENMYKAQIDEYRLENTRLRNENNKLRKSRDRRSLIFGIIGVAVGSLLW